MPQPDRADQDVARRDARMFRALITTALLARERRAGTVVGPHQIPGLSRLRASRSVIRPPNTKR